MPQFLKNRSEIALASVTDSATGQTRKYYYDFLDRLVKYTEEGGTGLNSHAVLYTYDKINNLAQRQETVNAETWATSYAYDQDNRLTDITTASSKRLYTYDGFSRTTQKETRHAGNTVLNSYLSYRTVNSNTTSQVSVLNNVSRNGNYSARYAYTYDNNGNITAVTVLYKDGTSHTTTYLYDSANQLIRENNQAAGKTWTWSYDAGGNLRSKREFAYNTGTLGTPDSVQGYAYTNTNWGDQVSTHAGKAITYDGVGNMLTYGDRTLTWKHGRQLETLKDGTNPAWAFTYDDAGMRLKRTNGTIAYTYVYDGGQLSYMSRGNETLRFTYDGSGTPVSVTYNDGTSANTYYYVTNLQGDVTALLKPDGTCVVEYTYDAWGKLLSTTGTLAGTLGVSNPLRYRGYVYDIETGLYYLQSRYYDPQLGRFINGDEYASTGFGLLGNNMFTYCANNPVRYTDDKGTSPVKIEPTATDITYSYEQDFPVAVGTITVVVSYTVETIGGYTVLLDTIEVEVTDKEIVVTTPDGSTFNFTYDTDSVKADSYSLELVDDGSLNIVASEDGMGVSASFKGKKCTFEIQLLASYSTILRILEKIAEYIPPVSGGGYFGGGQFEMHNSCMMLR